MLLPRVLAAVALLSVAAGCGNDGPSRPPASQAGRACQAAEYDLVEAALGVRFDTADAARVDETYSCVLSQAGRSFPDLTVTLSASAADELIFQTTATPSGSTAVENLGRRAYQIALPPAGDPVPSGPAVQVGWLSAAPQIMTLRYTWDVGATDQDVATLTPLLVDFARGVETRIVAG